MKKSRILLLFDNIYIVLLLLIITFLILGSNSIIFRIFLFILLLYFVHLIFNYDYKYIFIYFGLSILIIINLISYNNIYNKNSNVNIIDDKCKIVDVTYKDNYQKIKLIYKKFYYFFYLYDEDINKLIKPGSICYIKGNIEFPNEEELEGCFNYKKYLYYEKCIGNIKIEEYQLIKHTFHFNIFKFVISNYYDKYFDNLSSSYLKALILGEKSSLDTDLKDNINSIGISHLFVVSGLHVSIIVLILGFIFDKFKIKEVTKNIITIIVLFIYLIITSFLISVIRVFLSQILKFLNKDRQISSFNLFSINVIIVMILFPLKVFTLSFILSYLISGIIILSKKILFNKSNIFQMFLISLLSTLITLPIVVSINGSINFLSIIYNLFYIPFVSYIILPISIIVSFLPFLNIIYKYIILIFNFLININSNITIGNINFPKINALFFLIYYFILYKIIVKYEQNKLVIKDKINIFFLIFLLLWNNIRIFNFNILISFLNVSEGDATLITYPNNMLNILIDTGEEKEITTYLKRKGINKLDYLIISHGDSDHMGQLLNIIKTVRVRNIILSMYDYNTINEINKLIFKPNIIVIKELKTYNLNNIKMHVIGPLKNYQNTNDNSLVFILDIENFKILFTGDISINVEKELIDKYKLQVDILKVGHHGSKYSSCKEFIEKVDFKYAVAMNGYNNPFGFPNEEVITRFKGYNLLNTKEYKTITFEKNIFKKDFYLKLKKT